MCFSEHEGEKAAGTPEVTVRSELMVVLKAHTDDDAFAGQFLCKIDLVARRALDEVNVWQPVADLDQDGRRGVEEAAASD
jgi:hypothetical protein